jgi:transglutaminase-like putative cysteine protease
MTILTVRHITTYQYKQPVSFGEHRMMLRPRESHDQRLLESKLEITPKPTNLRWIQDAFGNHVAIARFAGRAEALRFDSTIRLDHSPVSGWRQAGHPMREFEVMRSQAKDSTGRMEHPID